jgi:hypothetical protein
MAIFKVKFRLKAENFSLLTWEECGPCPGFACYTLLFALQLREIAQRGLSQCSLKCKVGTIQCVGMAALWGSQDKSIAISLFWGTRVDARSVYMSPELRN